MTNSNVRTSDLDRAKMCVRHVTRRASVTIMSLYDASRHWSFHNSCQPDNFLFKGRVNRFDWCYGSRVHTDIFNNTSIYTTGICKSKTEYNIKSTDKGVPYDKYFFALYHKTIIGKNSMTSNIKVTKILRYGAFALSDEHVLKLFKNMVLKRVFGIQRVEETRHFKKYITTRFISLYLAVGIAIFHFHFKTLGYTFRAKCIIFGQNILSTKKPLKYIYLYCKILFQVFSIYLITIWDLHKYQNYMIFQLWDTLNVLF